MNVYCDIMCMHISYYDTMVCIWEVIQSQSPMNCYLVRGLSQTCWCKVEL